MRIFFAQFLCLMLSFALLQGKSTEGIQAETMPLSEIKSGMKGQWKTVVSGTELDTFNFEVIGVVPHFIGPKRSVILAKATDPSQILSGPVSGMSGSPCYIDGKLVGAYAYGFTWPKEQAIIGITPIADMFETIDKESQRDDSKTIASVKDSKGPGFQERLAAWGDPDKMAALLEIEVSPANSQRGSLKALPTPLYAGGISSLALGPFKSALSAMGFDPMQAPIGSTDALSDNSVFNGSALAGVLMDGDFPMAAVGTVTWREGNRFLAFGHPFFGSGDVDMPVAPAEVLTVVRSVPGSFKLANVGEVIGSLRQDRLTAVYGELGRKSPTTPLRYTIKGVDGEVRQYSGNLFRDRDLSPMLASVALMESLLSTMEADIEQTFSVKSTFSFKGYEPLVIERVSTGPGAGFGIAIENWLLLSLLVDNPFEDVQLEGIDVEIEQSLGWQETTLEALRSLSGTPKSGEDVSIGLTLGRYLEDSIKQSISVPLPKGTEDETLTLFIGDARTASSIERGWSTRSITSFEGLLDYLGDSLPNNKLYVKLLRAAKGLRIDGQELPALPPSSRLLINNSRTITPIGTSSWLPLWEDSIEVPGAFYGSYYHKLNIR